MQRFIVGLCISLATTVSYAEFFRTAPVNQRPNPFSDQQGRVKHLISFAKGVADQFPDDAVPSMDGRFHFRHGNRAKNFVRSLELQYGLSAVGMTSWVGNTVTAYLDLNQVERLQRDSRVTMLTEIAPGVNRFAGPPWSDSSPVTPPDPYNYEMRSWGHVAVNGRTSSVGSGYTKIYVYDAGHVNHQDLGGITRVNLYSGFGASDYSCWSHTTAVIGIINAINGNVGTTGVLPGVSVVSVAGTSSNWVDDSPSITCGDPYSASNSDNVADGLDYIYWDVRNNNGGKPGVVNLSIAGGDFNSSGPHRALMATLATPDAGSGYTYMGAFIAQAAGNNGGDACSYAYGNASSNDGIMVVGSVNSSGDASSFSNTGSCVEVYAPGEGVYFPWGSTATLSALDGNTWNNPATTYANWVNNVNGTSFSAPHITAIAASLQKTSSITTSVLIETAVRGTLYHASKTAGGQTVYYATIP